MTTDTLMMVEIHAFGSIEAKAAPISDMGTKINSKKGVFDQGMADAF